MQYFGGKARIANQICEYLNSVRKPNQVFLEPMCGGLNITSKIGGEIIACDYNKYIIALYNAILKGYKLPDYISEEEYYELKYNKEKDEILAGFVGFGCSYSGKFFGNYAKNNTGRNYCKNAKNSLMRKFNSIDKNNIQFIHSNYKDLKPIGYLIYCDPPYKSNTQSTMQSYGVEEFDSSLFWEVMREWSKDNDVYISEYEAPKDFECVLEIPTKTDIRCIGDKKQIRIERIFKYKEQS